MIRTSVNIIVRSRYRASAPRNRSVNTLTDAVMSLQQPAWHLPPRQLDQPVLKIFNSLTKTKTEFIPNDGSHVKWYNCGPTVYDASHMGHARNYVTQDILRRIMTDYFGYDVHFVMNVTDIDDKIIVRARQNHLFSQFRKSATNLSADLLSQVSEAWGSYVRENVSKGLPDEEKPSRGEEETRWPRIAELARDQNHKLECLKRDEKFDMHFTAANRSLAALEAARHALSVDQSSGNTALRLIDESRDILASALDKKLKDTVTDPSIFRSLAAYWESQFFKDMERLHVRYPDTVTRVTEYVPEVVEFVQGIIKNGYGYESEGSVYFDTGAFDSSDRHDYAKLEPWSKGNRELLAEGEGVLSSTSGQRSASDFALWKASKPGEPSWSSPWGPGRPGWHIECSVMASAIFGDSMDIHSGGIDLAFPHHDNEIAQSEAYHECGAWVNYFIHTGHLHIEGLKMSKSLKNFITIDEILQRFTARQLRLAFLSQLWNAKIDFSDSMMTGEVKSLEATFNNFFTNVRAIINQARAHDDQSIGEHSYNEAERELMKSLYASKSAFRAAICDSFNTPEALKVMRVLVSRINIYINSPGRKTNVSVVEQCARWIGEMLRMFGLGEGQTSEIGWGQEDEGAGGVNREETLMPYLRILSSFRDGVRQLAIAKNDNALKEILKLCDKLRDDDLVSLGVALDDQEDGKALVKLVSPAELMKAREEKRLKLNAQAAKKAAADEEARQKRLAKIEKGRVPPEEMFRPPNVPEGAYSQWDEHGLPTATGSGEELSKNKQKNARKDWDTQRKLHEVFLVWKKEQESGLGS
ncbi:tRNA synthetases class I (C) catalytic domain-containing protein [Suillus ampliporus]|nr:tRNA synthetases class I (C) catalytic domain-containing protein [Suillus ampliporus]